MRFVMQAHMPVEPFNTLVANGSAGETLRQILEELAPEAVYFTEQDGCRSAILIIDIDDVAEIPKYAEPFFLSFEAHVEFRVAMTPEDLGRAGLEALGARWS